VADASPTLPDLVLYGKPGCHLCEDARATIDRLLRSRADAGLPIPRVVERDILSDPTWERDFFLTIPVVELGGRRLELATSQAKIRVLLADVLDASIPDALASASRQA
jgi:hypothetical protein